MTNILEISAYQSQHYDALIRLYQTAFPDDPAWNDPAFMITSKLDIDPKGLLIGSFKGKLVATIMAGYDGHRGWINCLAVAPDHRGQGFGKAMIDAAIHLLNSRGAVKVNLQIRGDNTKLQRHYESLGFVTEDRISMSIMTDKGKSFTE